MANSEGGFVLMKRFLTALFLTATCMAMTGITAFAESKYIYDAQKASFIINCDSTTLHGDRAMLMVFEGTEYDINKLVSVEYNNSVTDDVVLSFDFNKNECDYGSYLLYLSITHPGFKADKTETIFYYNDPKDVADCYEAFKTSTTVQDFKDDYATYANTMHVLNSAEIEETIDDRVIEYYFMLRALYLRGEGNLEFKDTNDVLLCIKGAVLLDAIENNDANLKDIYIKYQTALDGIYISDADIEKVQQLFTYFTDSIESEDDLYEAIRKASAFAPAIEGTNQTMVDIINNYGTEFGVDFDYMQEKGITVANAVRYMDFKENMEAYMMDFKTAVKNAVDAATMDVLYTGSNGSSGSSGHSSSNSSINGGISQKPVLSNPAAGLIPSTDIPSTDNEEKGNKAPEFSDMDQAPWAEKYIKYCNSKGIINGFEDGTFRPNDFVTREQFVKMVIEGLDLAIVAEGINNFQDVENGSWYEPYVRSAHSLDITNGVGDNMFGIGINITRQELVTMLYRAYWIDSADATNFTDNSEIAEYASTAVAAYSGAGILNGYGDGSFKPNALATRAEAAAIITRLVEGIAQQEF